MNTTPTRPDDLNPGDRVLWAPAPGGIAEVAHVLVPTDRGPNSRNLEFTFGGTVWCNRDDEFSKVEPG